MSDSKVVPAIGALPRQRPRLRSTTKMPERRLTPRPPLAEIRRGGSLRLMPPVVITGAVRLVEFLIVALLGFAIYLAYVEREGSSAHFVYLAAVGIAAAATILILQVLDLYRVAAFTSFVRSFARIAVAWTLVIAGMMSLAFFVKVGADFSRVWIATWYASSLAALFGERLVLSSLARHWIRTGRLNRRAVIVGGGAEAEELIKALEASHDTDIRIVGIFDDRGPHRVSPIVSGYPKLGNINELVDFARHSRVDLLIVSLPVSAEKRLLSLLKKLWVLPVDIRLSAHANTLRFRPRTYSYIGNVPFIDIADKPITDWEHVRKWLFDKLVACAMLIVLAPVMLARRARHQARHRRGRSSSARSARASTTRSSTSTSSARCMWTRPMPTRASSSPRTIRASHLSDASSARRASTSCRSSSTF